MEPAQQGKFGTALIMGQSSLWKKLWGDDIAIEDFVPAAAGEREPNSQVVQASVATGARSMEIFLDFVAAQCYSDNIPIFDEKFYFNDNDSARVGVVGREIREIVDRLQRLGGMPEAATVVEKLNKLLKDCGEAK